MNLSGRFRPIDIVEPHFLVIIDKDFKDDKHGLEYELTGQSIDSQIVSKNMENLNVISVVNFVKNNGKTRHNKLPIIAIITLYSWVYK